MKPNDATGIAFTKLAHLVHRCGKVIIGEPNALVNRQDSFTGDLHGTVDPFFEKGLGSAAGVANQLVGIEIGNIVAAT